MGVLVAKLTGRGSRREIDMPASERGGAAYELRGVIGARLFYPYKERFFG